MFEERVEALDVFGPGLILAVLGVVLFAVGFLFPLACCGALVFLPVGVALMIRERPGRRRPDPAFPPPAVVLPPPPLCPTCGSPALYVPETQWWYCGHCGRYLPEWDHAPLPHPL